MFAYYHSHGATLHCVINMDLDMTPYYHFTTNMEPYYTPQYPSKIYSQVKSLLAWFRSFNIALIN